MKVAYYPGNVARGAMMEVEDCIQPLCKTLGIDPTNAIKDSKHDSFQTYFDIKSSKMIKLLPLFFSVKIEAILSFFSLLFSFRIL